ncbi:MAG: hypothetical protein A2293_07025 [Elusimicrobia bacterium RIFOXYB2_FULL_49_7]|nr:MAG: hypothetical protein A2293_07025 [Elusimicrobia bacterium RIFOXYB2_FULL_49_7]
MKDKRTLKRRQLVYYFPVYIRNTDILAGHLADLTHEGLMLVHSTALEIGELFPLRIMLPEKSGRAQTLDLLAECRWVKPDTQPDQLAMGFRFIDLSDLQRLEITRLILEYRLGD